MSITVTRDILMRDVRRGRKRPGEREGNTISESRGKKRKREERKVEELTGSSGSRG